MDRPLPYYQVAQFDEFCTCGQRIAVYQREYEELEQEFLKQGYDISESRIRVLKKLGRTKLCCLKDFTFFPQNFICDSTKNALVDTTTNKGTAIQKNTRAGNASTQVGWEFNPKKQGEFGFNLNNYSLKLWSISRPSCDEIGLNRTSGNIPEKMPVQFANFIPTRTQDYPLEEPGTAFPTIEELLSLI